MASNYKLSITRAAKQVDGLRGFALDQPQTAQAITDVELSGGRLRFFGWVLAADADAEPQVYIKEAGQRHLMPLNTERPDVISTVLGQPPKAHPQLTCGFDHYMQLTADNAELCVEVNGQEHTLFTLSVEGSLKVLEGKEDWLFLDNDANDSVAQHTGKMALGLLSRWGWQRFFKQTQHLAQPFALMIAPSKETVYPQFYPIAKAGKAPIEQMLALAPADYPVVYPVSALANAAMRTFRKNDTHWSLPGASVASHQLLVTLGLGEHSRMFANDTYVERDVIGDLGNKLYPPALSAEVNLKGANYHPRVAYDNQLPNFGRTLIVDNPDASSDHKLVMFASSSGYSMLHYLYRVFKRIIFVHTAGNVDKQLLQTLGGDFVVSQTNARFVIRAPKVGVSVKKLMQQKLRAETASARATLLQKSQQQQQRHPDDSDIRVLHRLLANR